MTMTMTTSVYAPLDGDARLTWLLTRRAALDGLLERLEGHSDTEAYQSLVQTAENFDLAIDHMRGEQ